MKLDKVVSIALIIGLLVVLCWWTIHIASTCQDRVQEVVDKCNAMLEQKIIWNPDMDNNLLLLNYSIEGGK